MYLPAGYSDPETEYRSLVEGVTLWDVSVQRIVEIRSAPAVADEGLLALTAGWDAVASLRPVVSHTG